MKRVMLLMFSLMLVLAMGAAAQEQDVEQAGDNVEQAAEETGQAAEGAAEEAGQAVEETAQDIETGMPDEQVSLSAIRMDTLRDFEMVTRDGDEFGSIEDVVIKRDGSIQYLVVQLTGDALGYGWGYEQYLIPPQAIALDAEDENLVMKDVALEDLKDYPGIEPGYFGGEWGYADGWDNDYAGWWGAGYGYDMNTAMDDEWGFAGFEGDRTAILGSELNDFDFVSPDGEDLGDAEGAMLDLENHRVSYIALSAGGVLGIGDTNIAVPLKAITFNAADEELVIDLSEEAIENVEGFEEGDAWPAGPDQTLFEQQ